MATKTKIRYFRTTIRRFSRSVRYHCSDFFKIVGTYLLHLLFVSALTIVVMVTIALVYNPIVFPLWVLICYKIDWAKKLYGYRENDVDGVMQSLYRDILHWEIRLFPLWMKKSFVIVSPECFAISDQVWVATKLKEHKSDFIKKMSENAVKELWQKGTNDDRYAIVATRRNLTKDVLNFLLQQGDVKELSRLIQQTPPKECVVQLIAGCADANTAKTSEKILKIIIFKHGLNAELVDKAFNCEIKSLRDIVSATLTERNQYQMMLKLRDADNTQQLWEKFCTENSDICESAQKLMRYWMFEKFYATGHHLCERSQIYFLIGETQQKARIARCIFQNEKKLSDEVLALIRSNPELYVMYLKR